MVLWVRERVWEADLHGYQSLQVWSQEVRPLRQEGLREWCKTQEGQAQGITGQADGEVRGLSASADNQLGSYTGCEGKQPGEDFIPIRSWGWKHRQAQPAPWRVEGTDRLGVHISEVRIQRCHHICGAGDGPGVGTELRLKDTYSGRRDSLGGHIEQGSPKVCQSDPGTIHYEFDELDDVSLMQVKRLTMINVWD